MSKPRNIILVVADSLRYDSVYKDGSPGVPYLEENALQFTNARSSGCWTLPATTCLFTGELPHQHGATSQSRWVKEEVPTLSEKLKEAGYYNVQVTANVVTTDLFNVSKGFDEVHKVWHMVESRYPWLLNFVLSINRPRVRRALLRPKDVIVDKISEDIRQGIIWSQKTAHDALAKAQQIIEQKNAEGKPVFMFVNLMETHYPYHIADTFTMLSSGLFGKIHEWKVLFHFLGQTFLKTDKPVLTQADLDILRTKQQLAWKLIRKDVDDFCRTMHRGQENLVVFGSDHGDNFGEQGWQYHFSNVTDGGNRVPFFWLPHRDAKAGTVTHEVSSRFIHHDILRAAGIAVDERTMLQPTETNLPVLQSYWYDNEGETMQKYKYNQMAFVQGNDRFVLRAGQWMYAPVQNGTATEPVFDYVEKGFNPLEEVAMPAERRQYLQQRVKEFSEFSDKIMSKTKPSDKAK